MGMPPNIAEVDCSRIRFRDGDRVLVRTYANYDRAQMDRMRAMVRRWAGREVEVLFYNANAMEITVEQGNELPGDAQGR